tara:strand:+ start:8996 stop:10288 length:1293 start_codon:yes stop_codon:yes gene_type:complete
MSTFKQLSPADIKEGRSFLNQLVDVVQEDISGSSTRKKYQVFVTGGIGPGVTSSIFQTVFDQDHSLQTSNQILDLAFGLYSGSQTVTGTRTGIDTSGKPLFGSGTIMMREKVNIYKQFAQLLMKDAEARFTTPFFANKGVSGAALTTDSDGVDEALFICFKRLFSRDSIKKETFAMKFFQSASHDPKGEKPGSDVVPNHRHGNINVTSVSGSKIYTDVGASGYFQEAPGGGEVANLVDSSDTSRNVGLLFYEQGIALLDLKKVISGTQFVSGVIGAMQATSQADFAAGQTVIGSPSLGGSSNPNARFIPDLVVSASVDNILDHIATCRFGSSTNTAITFQNVTEIHSTLIFCRAAADEFNLSANPTFKDSDTGRIVVIDPGEESRQKPFTFVTSVCLYNAYGTLMAVAKLSRPIEKNDEKDLTFRVRLDF